MNILIIGNGFDIAHGLLTKYEHFLSYLYVIKAIYEQSSGFTLYPQCNIGDVDILRKSKILEKALSGFSRDSEKILHIFENTHCNVCDKTSPYPNKCSGCKLLKNAPENDIIDNNKWTDYMLWIFEQKKMRGKNWIDIEFEIRLVMQFIDEMKEDDGKTTGRSLLYGDIPIKEIMNGEKNYQASLEKKSEYVHILENDLDRFIQYLEQYMLLINKISIKPRLPDIDGLKDKIDAVLSFNYINTYEKCYERTPEKGKVEYNYIHGQAGKKNMILGFEEYLEGKDKDIKLLCIRFKKFFQRIYKGTGCEYKKWFSENEHHEVYVFGHSLDVTDGDIFKDFIMKNNVHTTIFYHDEEAHVRLIMNLYKLN